MTLRARLSWWTFLVRYRIARWRGKSWATGGLRPEWIFAYRRAQPGVLLPPSTESYGYFNVPPKPRVWKGDDA